MEVRQINAEIKKEKEKRKGRGFSKVKESLSIRSKKQNKEIKPGEKLKCEENNTSGNIFQRIFKRLSLRLKKKRYNDTESNLLGKNDKNSEEETRSLSAPEDQAIIALCNDVKEEKEPSSIPSCSISNSRPPLPTMRRPPPSTSRVLSRP